MTEILQKYILRYFFIVIATMGGSMLSAQDIQFSQFYAVDMYQNPAFTGASHYSRAMLHQRIQWPNLEASYVSTWASFDTYFDKYKSSVGVSVLRDVQASDIITSTDVGLYYAYELSLNSQWVLRSGLQMNIVSRDFNYAKLNYPSQFDDQGMNSDNPDTDLSLYDQVKIYPDISAGLLLYSRAFWFGFSVHHLNKPEQIDFIEAGKLPMNFAVTSGYKIVLGGTGLSKINDNSLREVSITPTFHYKTQGEADQLDFGIYSNIKHFTLGMWYRGIPVKQYNSGLNNHESLVFIAGLKGFNWGLSYSYDYTVSTLSVVTTGGSHELNLYYTFKEKKRSKATRKAPCPRY